MSHLGEWRTRLQLWIFLASSFSRNESSCCDRSATSSPAATLQGLALPALAKDAWQMPAFFRMVQQGILRDPVFSVWMDPNADAVPAGEVLFGGADATKFEGHLAIVPVISKKCVPPSPPNIVLI